MQIKPTVKAIASKNDPRNIAILNGWNLIN